MIKWENLCCGYEERHVLQAATQSVAKGSLCSVIGRNGSGKSTLLKTIAGVLPPLAGKVAIQGKEFHTLSSKERAKLVAYGMQRNGLPQITVEGLVLHGRFPHLPFPRKTTDVDIEIVKNAMTEMKIEHLARKNIAEISGGEAQKAFLAMLLAQQTEVLVLDEPNTYLDVYHQQELLRTLIHLREKGKTILLSLHDIQTALTFSDEICVLANGIITFTGTPEQLLKTKTLQEIFGLDIQVKKEEGRVFYSLYTVGNSSGRPL